MNAKLGLMLFIIGVLTGAVLTIVVAQWANDKMDNGQSDYVHIYSEESPDKVNTLQVFMRRSKMENVSDLKVVVRNKEAVSGIGFYCEYDSLYRDSDCIARITWQADSVSVKFVGHVYNMITVSLR